MTNLSFTASDGRQTATIVSEGVPMTVQLHQEIVSNIIFQASIGTLNPITIKVLPAHNRDANVITTINVPNGVKITIKSDTSVSGGYES